MRERVDARKTRIGPSGLGEVLDGIRQVTVAKGKKVVRFDLKDRSTKRLELAAHLIGPTGNLRAPAIRLGTHLIVGFHEEEYRKLWS